MIPPSHNTHFYRCIFTDGDEYSIDFLYLCKKQHKLTFNTDLLNPKYVSPPLETPFKEIRIALPEEHCFKPIIRQQKQTVKRYEQCLSLLQLALEDYLLKLDDNEKYLVFHSSGLDSRFISGTMAKLRREGKKKFDNVHFRCHEPEREAFMQIMKKEGWKKSQYSYFDLRGEDNYDVGRTDISVNGWCSYTHQMNFWSDIVSQEKDWIVMLGEGSDIGKFMWYYKDEPFHYCDNYCLNMLIAHTGEKGEWDNQYALTFKDVSMPLWSWAMQYYYAQVKREWVIGNVKTGWDNLRLDLVDRLGLGGVEFLEHEYSWNISDKRKREMNNAFYCSRFYGEYMRLLPQEIDFFTNPYGWESKLWGFATTVYEQIYNK